jgi:hypothetical protein
MSKLHSDEQTQLKFCSVEEKKTYNASCSCAEKNGSENYIKFAKSSSTIISISSWFILITKVGKQNKRLQWKICKKILIVLLQKKVVETETDAHVFFFINLSLKLEFKACFLFYQWSEFETSINVSNSDHVSNSVWV